MADNRQTFAPLIEFHGYDEKDAFAIIEKIKEETRKTLDPYDYKNLVFSIKETKVFDVDGDARPFLRFYSSEYAIVHKIEEALKMTGWEGEMEFIRINRFIKIEKSAVREEDLTS